MLFQESALFIVGLFSRARGFRTPFRARCSVAPLLYWLSQYGHVPNPAS